MPTGILLPAQKYATLCCLSMYLNMCKITTGIIIFNQVTISLDVKEYGGYSAEGLDLN